MRAEGCTTCMHIRDGCLTGSCGVAWDKQLLALVCESGKVASLLLAAQRLVDRSSFQLQLACRFRQRVHGQHENGGSYHVERHLG